MPVRFALTRPFLYVVCARICFDGLSLHENKDRHGGTFLCGSMDDGSLLGYLTARNVSRCNLDRFGLVACPKARSVVSDGCCLHLYVRTRRRGRVVCASFSSSQW